jgi:hypothetical protein
MDGYPSSRLFCLICKELFFKGFVNLFFKIKLAGCSEVVQFITNNGGGKDPQNSNFAFHFRTFGDIFTCRDMLRIAIPAAFHLSSDFIQAFNAQLPAANHLPTPVPIGSAWFLLKTSISEMDLAEDKSFFL